MALSGKEERQRERFASRQSRTAAKYLRRLMELKGAPETMGPFFEVLRSIYVDRTGVTGLTGQKLVGTYCVMVPQELVYAAGAFPVKLCSGDYTAFFVGDGEMPRDACPLVKAVAGFVSSRQMPIYEDCSLMVVPATCDGKKKIAGMLMDHFPVQVLQVPATRGDAQIDAFTAELYTLTERLEEVTGQRVTYPSLEEGMRLVGACQRELSILARLRREDAGLLMGCHALAALQACSYMPPLRQVVALRALVRELEERKMQGWRVSRRQLPRILLTGSPLVFPNLKVPLLIEEMGGLVAADETCLGERGLWDPAVTVDPSFDGMMRALANRSLRPCSCPTFTDGNGRIYRLRQLIRERQIQGVVYHVLRGCLVYDFEYRMIEEEMGRLGIPIIRVESDYNEEDVEQLRIRIEAFLELISQPERRTEQPGIGRA